MSDIRSALRMPATDGIPGWCAVNVDFRLLFSELGTDTLRDWCLAHLRDERPHGAALLIRRSNGSVHVEGEVFSDELAAVEHRTLQAGLIEPGVNATAVAVCARECLRPGWWEMHLEAGTGEGSVVRSSREYQAAGTAAAGWTLLPASL